MTQIKQIYTDFISVNPFNLRHPRSLFTLSITPLPAFVRL